MIKIECDQCGAQEVTKGAADPAAGLPFYRLPVPDGWKRVRFPMMDGSARDKELCPDCVKFLWTWLGKKETETEE